ncbi:MAG: DUF445 family protein [Spirochaetales bacterium]|nr:DUF445 family protein [Spirochaetales bacterium]
MNGTLIRLLPYVLPPVLGAVIGYVTNYVAIRMLFRPLTEKRVLGVRIPFTPGVIPRQRYDLSHSIARMVSTKLFTVDVLKSKLNEPAFADSLGAGVARFTADVLDRLPDPDEGEGTATREVPDLVCTLLEGFLSSDAFRSSARRIVIAAIEGALKLNVGRITPKDETIRRLVGQALRTVIDGGAADAIRTAVVKWVSAHVAEDTPLHEALGPKTLDRLADLLPKSYNPILDSLVTFLRQPETREELAIHGRELMKRILKRLNLFQRLLVSATQYDRNLDENMPAIVSDVIDSLETAGRNPDTMIQIVNVFRSRLAEWGETGVGTLGISLSIDLSELANRVVSAGLELLGREAIHERVSGSIVSFLERRGKDTLGDLIGETVGIDEESLKERAGAFVDRWMELPDTSARVAEQVSRFVSTQLFGARTTPLRDLIALSDQQKERIDMILARKLREQLELRIPELIDGLDIHGMVVQKIDSLDVESVEQLLLMVIAKHLKWINLFGALLGAIIGGVQVLVSQLT